MLKALKTMFSLSISIFLTLGLLMVQFSFFTHIKLLKPELYTKSFEKSTLYSSVNRAIKSQLEGIAKSCNFPKDIFSDMVTDKWIKQQMLASTYETIDYMNYKSNSLPKVDTSYVSEKFIYNINNYLLSSNISVENTPKKDLDQLNREIQAAIKQNINAININKYSKYTYFQSFRIYSHLLYLYNAHIYIATLALIFMLLILNYKSLSSFAAWSGYSFIAAGLLSLLPALAFMMAKLGNNIYFEESMFKQLAIPIMNDYMTFFIYTGGSLFFVGILLILIYALLEGKKKLL